jgi:hypothetical protein
MINHATWNLPPLALSVRQPWAWAIIHGGKDIENRTWRRWPGIWPARIAIHAAKAAVSLAEYCEARAFMWERGDLLKNRRCPLHAALDRGGIIGSVELVDIVTASDSPWFEGPYGYVLRDPQPCEFIPCRGALGFFRWEKTK